MSRSLTLLVLPLAVSFAACGGDNTDDPGADAATAADGNTGGADAGTADTANTQAPSCDPSFGAAPGCGNNPAGSWTYRAACGASAIEDDVRAACNTAVFRATSHVVTGSLDFTATTYTVDVTDRADVEMTIPAACAATFGGCAGVATALNNQLSAPTQCTQEGADCSCTSMVTVATAQTGTYTSQGGVITTTPSSGNGASYNFCVESGVLRYREQGDAVVYVLTPR